MKKTKLITEASLSRLFRHITTHDTGIITAFRGDNDRETNLALNGKLSAYLKKKRYGVTAVKGAYIEGYNTAVAREVQENSFFVVNLPGHGDFKQTLLELGAAFDQDSILYTTKGGANTYLIGTSERADSYPPFGQSVNLGKFKPKAEGEFMTRVAGQPFQFAEEDLSLLETYDSIATIFGKWGCSAGATEVEKFLEKRRL